jgi:hypothetical protein
VPTQAAYRLELIYLGSWFKYRQNLKKKEKIGRTLKTLRAQDWRSLRLTCNHGTVRSAFSGHCRTAADEKNGPSRPVFINQNLSGLQTS